MEVPVTLNRLAAVASSTSAAGALKHVLNVVLVYQDDATHQWAREFYSRVVRLVGEESLSLTWWNMHELSQPAVLAGAVSKTLRSDVLVVALRAAEPLPLGFCVWADTWLPHRPQGSGSLVALIGRSVGPLAHSDGVRKYLSILARRGRLDFLVEERKLERGAEDQAPVMPSASSSAPASAARAAWTAADFRFIPSRRLVNRSPSKRHKLKLSYGDSK